MTPLELVLTALAFLHCIGAALYLRVALRKERRSGFLLWESIGLFALVLVSMGAAALLGIEYEDNRGGVPVWLHTLWIVGLAVLYSLVARQFAVAWMRYRKKSARAASSA